MLINKFLPVLILWCACQNIFNSAHAQVISVQDGTFSYASVSCFIISPIGITKVQDMNFGAIVSGNAGSVVLSPDGNNLLTTGNVSLRTTQSSITAATFEVNAGLDDLNGKNNSSAYSITLPTSDITLVSNEGYTMRVSNFTSSPSSSGYGTLTNGKGVLTVGATLHVNASQGIGKYISSAPFPVTVNFD
jgi:hypothetical protein